MKLGEQSNEPARLWRELSISTRREISLAFWDQGAPGLIDWAVKVLSKRFNSREQTVRHWPKEKCASHLAEITDLNGMLVQDVLRTYFFAQHKPLMAGFLDSLGIKHESCSISGEYSAPMEGSLRASISRLLSGFPRDRVELYLRILLGQGPSWSGLSEIDLDEMQASNPPAPGAAIPIPRSKDLESPMLQDQEMSKTPTLHELKDDLESLRAMFKAAAERLEEAASELALGVLPDADLERRVSELRVMHEKFSRFVVAFAEKMNLDPTADSLNSFSEFEKLMARIEDAQKALDDRSRKIQEVCDILDLVLKLERKDGREFPSLRNCQDAARMLRNQLADTRVESDLEVNAKVHAFKTLLLMVESGKGISEEESAVAYDEISEVFGTPLVLAIERGLIVFPVVLSGGDKDDTKSPESGKAVDDTAAEPVFSEPRGLDSQTVSSDVGRSEAVAPEVEPVASVPLVPTTTVDRREKSPAGPHSHSESTDDTPFRVAARQTTQGLALELLASESEPGQVDIQRLAWLALTDQRLSAAYHLVACLERLQPNLSMSIPSSLVRAFALGIKIRQPHGHIATQLKADFGLLARSVDRGSTSQAFAYRLVSVSAALCPAISAPGSGGLDALKLGLQKLSGLKSLYSLCGVIADYAAAQFALDPTALEYADNADGWNQQVSLLQEESESWAEKARGIQFKFPPAAKVWRKWLDRGGMLESLLSYIRNKNPGSTAEIDQIISRIATENKIRAEVNATDRHLKGSGLSGEINAAALAVIQRHTRQAVEFARRWLSLQEHRPSEKVDYRLSKLLEVRNAVDGLQEDIQQELAKGLKGTDDIRVRAALNCCGVALRRLGSLLHPKREHRRAEPDLKYILSSEMLLIPGLTLAPGWEPLLEDRALLRVLEESLARNREPDWQEIFQVHAEKWRDHDATDRIIEYLTWNGENDALVQRLANDQKTHLRSCQDALLRQIEESRKKIEIGVSRGLVREKERSEFLQIVERVSDRASVDRNFREAEAQLSTINSAIDKAKTTLAEQVRQAMATRGILRDNSAYGRITGILESGDIDTATEYIELVGRGGSLPETDDQQDSFGAFFPQASCEIEEFLNDSKSSGLLLSRIENQKGLPGVEMGSLSDSKTKEAVEMVEAWLSLKKVKRANQQQLKMLFERLGFDVVSISEGAGQPRAWVSLVVKPLNHRDQCPIPYFGSSANGHYRVLCIWDHPSEEEIISLIRPGRLGDAPIVLYFDRFTEMKRRNLASLCRAEHLSFLFIDEILLVFLCGEAKARLPVLFSCALPFSFSNPYTTTSSLVPPEMFYGRRYERSQITEPMGSCFVYGGRQLGKTALLISIRDEYHDPVEGRIAIWFDLKAAGVTQDELWSNLAQAFTAVQVAGLDLERKRSDHAVIEQLQRWLDENEKRRILLLLDEADRFLESDSKNGFKRTSLLKGLMERTNRRFKVVFAGLHNVQRTIKQENQPLAHFGEPICIGPLLDGGEWKAAKALIEQPLRSMGFRFESPDLITRILAQTNYYPSLIQLYCNQLFQYLNRESPPSFDWRRSPPYLITAKHVEDAYTSRQLRNAIRERFELTLNLDPRYRVIALIIALYGQSSENAAFDSMGVSDIRSLATDFWARGFHDCRSEEDFRVLLDEMVGLGVLQEADGRFALRTPNVKSLLGTQDEIESKLMRSAQEEPVPAFEAHLFRTSDQKEVWKRNPLTAIQESSLHAERNAVSVLFGTRAAGLDDLNSFLARAFGNGFYFSCGKELTDRDYFKARLAEIKDKLKTGTSLILVQGCPWTLSWIEEAIEWIGKKTVSKFANVTFVADPLTAWRIAQNYRRLEELQSDRRLAVHSLQPWHDSVLWQWLGDCRIGTNATDEKELISQKTGNWPFLLMEFGKKAAGDPDWKRFLNDLYGKLDNRATNPEFADAFGLTIPEPREILNEMALLGGKISIPDLASLLDTVPQDVIENAVHWADKLSLVRCSARGEWELDPTVVKVLPFEK